MSEPCLQLEQGHRLLGVVQQAGDSAPGPAAGDFAADSAGGDSGRRGQRRDDRAVDVVLGDAFGAVGEQELHALAGLGVQRHRLFGADGLPDLDALSEQRVDRLGETRAGLVGRDVEQSDGVAGEDVGGVRADGRAVVSAHGTGTFVHRGARTSRSSVSLRASGGSHRPSVASALCSGCRSPEVLPVKRIA